MDHRMTMLVVPWALIIGCALVAGGGLYLVFDAQFLLKTRLQAIAALVSGLLIIFVTELSIVAYNGASFFLAQKEYVSKCYAEGEAAFPAERATTDNAAGAKISECVRQLGYEWSPGHWKCRDFEAPMNAYCWLPTEPFNRIVTRVQLFME
jgi:hypothetical protein